MRIDLTGKNALVTGGAAGIGRACARLLAEAGARVLVVDINLTGARQTVDTLPQGLAIRCDLGDPGDVTAMAGQAASEMGHVDILVNCAGVISYRRGVNGLSIEEWDHVLDVNVRGTYLVCRELMPGMKTRRAGKIINFSSLAARAGGIEAGIHYTTSKAALIGLTRALAKEGGPFGINVNAVAPGIITTGPVMGQIAGRESEFISQIPLRRLGEPMDVAKAVLFLSSSLADYVTGVILDVNGGIFIG